MTPSAIEISTVADLRVRLDRPDLADMPDFVSIVADQQAIDALKTELAGLSPEEVASHVRAFVTAHVKKETATGTTTLQLDQLRAAAGQAAKTVSDPDAALTATLSAAPALATAAAQGAIADIQKTPGVMGKIDKTMEHAGGIEDGFDGAFKKFEQEIKKMHPGVYKLLVWLDVFDDEPAEPIVAAPVSATPPDPAHPETKKKDYESTVGVLAAFSGKPELTSSLLLNPSIRGRRFSEVQDAYQAGESGIAQRLGILGSSDANVYRGVGVFVKHSDLLDDFLRKSHPNWRNETLEDVLAAAHSNTNLLDSFIKGTKRVEDDLKNGRILDAYLGFFNYVSDELSITPDEKGNINIGGTLGRRIETLRQEHPTFRLLSRELLITLKSDRTGIAKQSVLNPDLLSIVGQHHHLNDQEKDFIRQLSDFGRGMQETIVQHFSFGYPEAYKKFFSEHPLTVSQALDFFIVT